MMIFVRISTTAWILGMFVILRIPATINAESSHSGLRHLLQNESASPMERTESPSPDLSTLNCWMDPNTMKYICLSDMDQGRAKCSDQSSPVRAVRCWCSLTIPTMDASSNSDTYMHHCVACSSEGGSNTSTASTPNEAIYDCSHIPSEGFLSYAYNETLPNHHVDDSLYSATSSSESDPSSGQTAAVTVYENTIIIEPLQDVVILTVYNTTSGGDVVLQQGTTTGRGKVPKGPKPLKVHRHRR